MNVPEIEEYLPRGYKGLCESVDSTMLLTAEDVKRWTVDKNGKTRSGRLDKEYRLSCPPGYYIHISGPETQVILPEDGPQPITVPFVEGTKKGSRECRVVVQLKKNILFDKGRIIVRLKKSVAFDVVPH
jgi:hypothetical protein